MKNLRKKKVINKNSLIESVDEIPEASAQVKYSDVCAKKDVDFLKSLKVDEKSIGTFKEKLRLTSLYRKKMLSDRTIDLLEWFPYFFTCPDLVSWHSIYSWYTPTHFNTYLPFDRYCMILENLINWPAKNFLINGLSIQSTCEKYWDSISWTILSLRCGQKM